MFYLLSLEYDCSVCVGSINISCVTSFEFKTGLFCFLLKCFE